MKVVMKVKKLVEKKVVKPEEKQVMKTQKNPAKIRRKEAVSLDDLSGC